MAAAAQTEGASSDAEAQVQALSEVGRLCYARGWADAGGGTCSACLGRDPLRVLITAAKCAKERLSADDFVLVDGQGKPVVEGKGEPTAETPLHLVIYEHLPPIGAVLHTHSLWSTILSDFTYPQNNLSIEGFEMQKGLAGVTSHQAKVQLKVFENTQKIDELARRLRLIFAEQQPAMKHGFLLRRHGLYTWGADVGEARRHLEALEFLLEVRGRRTLMGLPTE
jgi:methylthioribulose-1-phosphate dehydratase